ncbi:MAG TPA: AAA family ATPase, partial [Acetobacteraceae bacterium]|nr:AAA family ATPase [Acetobacteraceae bacterium]
MSADAQAERRPISVMFCDLIDFTPMSARLDPEELQGIVREYQTRTAAAIARYGGFIARYVGDGVLIYFGWPEAREGDAGRAVRAGLGVVAAVGAAPVRGERLRVRIGIATGMVVVGEAVGTGEAHQQTAMGETPNRAARLQALAEPDSVVIDTATRQQIGRLFECRDLGAHALKGLPEPVPVWVVLGESAVVSRFEALHETRLAPMIGRDEELDLLLRRWHKALNGEGHVVLISGEPGIGKSRLIAALQAQIAADPHAELRYFCAPHAQEDALRPVIARWEQEAGFARGDTAEDRLRKLEGILPPDTSPDDVALLADMLGVAGGARYPELQLSPQRKREKLFSALNRRFYERTTKQPVLMIWEDMHWADPTSVELLDATMRLLPGSPVLLVATFRPEFQTSWVGHSGVTLLALSRLGQRDSAALATQVTLGHALAPATLDRIVTQTDGVPLFIEELTKAVLETGGAGASQAVPDTLKGSLMARLDRLPAARQVAQVGAVIGREFSHALLIAVGGLPESAVGEGLDQLVASGLAFRQGMPPDAVYRFKHALVQDTAYESLLRSRRTELHAAVAAVLETDPDIAPREPALLGHHFAHGGLIDRAATYFRIAGERSAERSAITETLAHLRRGLSLVESMPDNADRRRLEAELLTARGQIRLATGGQADAEARADFERALPLCRDLERADLIGRPVSGIWVNMMHRGEFGSARQFALELPTWSVLENDPQMRFATQFRLGAIDLLQARFPAAREALERFRSMRES